MMNVNYRKILDKVIFAKQDIEKLWQEAESKTFEDKHAYRIAENLVDQLETVIHRLERLTMPVIEGKLREDPEREKFELIRSDTGKGIGWQFSCGDYIEVKDDEGEWHPGRVEHTTRDGCTGYYFCNYDMDNPFLNTGMKARIRKAIND